MGVTQNAAICTAAASLGWPVAPLLRVLALQNTGHKRKCYFQFKISSEHWPVQIQKGWLVTYGCATELICHQQRWAKQSEDHKQKITSSALSTAADTAAAALNRIRLQGEIPICFLVLVSPSTKINSNNTGRSSAAGKCKGSQGDLGIRMSLGGLPKT